MEEDGIIPRTKVVHADLIRVDEREKIIVNVLGDDGGTTSFCWCIGNRRGKLINKQYINKEEVKLVNTQCNSRKKMYSFSFGHSYWAPTSFSICLVENKT